MPRGQDSDWLGNGSSSSSNISTPSTPTTPSTPQGNLTGDNHVAYQGGNTGYSDTMAEITRQQYDDWLKRFAPTEDKLIELATSGELYEAQQNRNQELSESNLARAENQSATTGAKYGLGDRRTDQQKNNLQINNALSLASMNNEGRQALGDLQNRIISGVSNSNGQKINKLGE